ncbi:MAG TPA: hypothetical protein VGM51_09685 [Armatimonadota bacterium]|jgi:hypothetical protein
MKLRALLSVGILACSGIAQAQNATPAAPAPVKIELKLAPGQIRAYKISVDQKGTMTLPGSGQNMPLNIGVTAYAKLIVDKQNDDGTWAARYKIGGMKTTMNGAPMNLPSGTDGMTIKGILSKTGAFKPTDDQPKSSGLGMGMSPGQSMSNVLGNLMNLPEKAVIVGDTWSTVVPLPFDATGKSSITVDSKVLGIDHQNGDQIVRIQHDSSGPLNMTMTQPMPMNIAGTIKGSGLSQVSVNSGAPLDDLSTQHMTLTVTGQNPSGNGDKMNISMDMVMTSHIESVVLERKAVVVKTPAKPPVKKAPAKGARK